jgi:DNA modification methylase
VTLYHGDCLDVLRTLPDCSVDAVVTDPPYGLEFMGKDWDKFGDVVRDPADVGGFQDGTGGNPYSRSRIRFGVGPGFQQWCEAWSVECLRVLKPGGHLLAFGGTRTSHRLACAIEDAGFEIRDSIAWLYGSGFPKSLDVSKAIDKRRDWTLVERLSGEIKRARAATMLSLAEIGAATLAATDGTYGKWYHRGGHMFFETGRSLPSRPEWDQLCHVLPIDPEFVEVYDEAEREVVGISPHSAARSAAGWLGAMDKPEGDRVITAPATPDAAKWQGWGTALKPAFEPIVVGRKPLVGTVAANVLAHGTGALNIDGCRVGDDARFLMPASAAPDTFNQSPPDNGYTGKTVLGRWPTNVVLDGSQADALDAQSGTSVSRQAPRGAGKGETGTYGVWGMADDDTRGHDDQGGASRFFPTFRYEAKAPAIERPRHGETAHPTVKPLDLMRWLVRLVTPRGGTVLEPFAGSGTTAEACILEGFKCIAIEREADYLPLIVQRISKPLQVGLGLDFGEGA